jgi:tetratricopeptide (TPR) repeat protein
MVSSCIGCISRQLFIASLLFIGGCGVIGNSNEKEENTETLGSFVESTHIIKTEKLKASLQAKRAQLTHKLTKEERSDKLAQIYRSILTLEPNRNVRAQIQHRMVQLDIKEYEKNDVLENKAILKELAVKYENLLTTYPERPENENIQYHLAKTYDMLAHPKKSILVIESLLKNYPNTQYYAELQFRRAELYYNVEQYPLAYKAYQAVLTAKNNEKYHLNSLYMSGWSLFKLNRLPEADDHFIQVLHHITLLDKRYMLANNNGVIHSTEGFSFDHVSVSHRSLAEDTQRVLSISLSQQQQSKSLIKLLKRQNLKLSSLTHDSPGKALRKFEHLLFENLANFLIEKKLVHDAVLTYENYLDYAPNSFWGTRFSLALIDLYQQKNQFVKIRNIKKRFVNFYGLDSLFWEESNTQEKDYALPYLSAFSLAEGHYLYAYAQELEGDEERRSYFATTAIWFKKYLDVATFANKKKTKKTNLSTHEYFLYAEASFEAQHFKEALNVYKMLAYSPLYKNKEITITSNEKVVDDISVIGDHNNRNNTLDNVVSLRYINQESAYATLITIAELLTPFEQGLNNKLEGKQVIEEEKNNNNQYQKLIVERKQLNDLYIENYGTDRRAKLVAVKAAEYAFTTDDIEDVLKYSNFVLTSYKADRISIERSKNKLLPKLDSIALKQVVITSQLKANIRYKFNQFEQAEKDYLLALNYEKNKVKIHELSELVASSIYEQATIHKALNTPEDTEIAIAHYLRLGKLIPHSKYRVNAEFDAANLLLASKQWARAIPVLTQFSHQFQTHVYASTIPAKLALSYEKLEDWSQAAKQLLVMVEIEKNVDLKRESQYTAAEYFLKAGDIDNAIANFRAYAHKYPDPFGVAQEVRFKMSEFYRETKEPNKRYYWFRKLISFHKKQENKLPATELGRSTYLASYAAFNLGQAHQQTFNQTKLKAPLNKSLKGKQQAMKEAINYYNLVFKWQLAEFVPQANYLIGQIYRDLATDVMKSERPRDLDALALEEYEFLLEEIAYPFEEKAIEVHQANAERAWDDIYDKWVKRSLAVLAEIEPAKYNKFETIPEVFNDIF